MRWIFHIGLHKAASTSIQVAWENTPDAYFLGRFDRKGFPCIETRKIVREFLPRVNEWNALPSSIRKWKKRVEAEARKKGKSTILISDEILSSASFESMMCMFLGWEQSIPNLHRLFRNQLHLVIIIRNQFDWIRSCYIQELRRGTTCNFHHYVAWHAHHFEAGRFRITYYAALSRYLKKKGIQHSIIPMEHLVDPTSLHGDLGKCLRIQMPPLSKLNTTPKEQSVIAWLERNRAGKGIQLQTTEARFDGDFEKELKPLMKSWGLDASEFEEWVRRNWKMREEFENSPLPPFTENDEAFMTIPNPLRDYLNERFIEQNQGLQELLGIHDLRERGYSLE